MSKINSSDRGPSGPTTPALAKRHWPGLPHRGQSPAQDPAGVDHRPGMILVPGTPDQLGPGGGVPLAGGGHPDSDACFELLLRRHIETFRPQPDARLHALETSPRPN